MGELHVSVDFSSDALYVYIDAAAGPLPVSRTSLIDDATLVDLADDGSVVGVEILRPNRLWPMDQILAAGSIPDKAATLLSALSRCYWRLDTN